MTKTLKKDEVDTAFTRKDFLAMADIGARHGVFEQHESEIISNLLRFGSVQVGDVMTPRTVVKAASAEKSIRDFFEANRELRFSRIPLYENASQDQVVGYVLKDEVLARMAADESAAPLLSLRRDIISVAEDAPIMELFNRFLATREHIALVTDAFGGMAGIVTMEDVLETLIGIETVDETDTTMDMRALARRNWEQRASRLGLLNQSEGSTGGAEVP